MIKKIKKRLLQLLLGLSVLYLLLLVPVSENRVMPPPAHQPFSWNRDSLWIQLENDFKLARQQQNSKTDSSIQRLLARSESLFTHIDAVPVSFGNVHLDSITSSFFSLASLIAARPLQQDSFLNMYNKIRNKVKHHSQFWDMNQPAVRNQVYRIMYGMRAAVEEVLLQNPGKPFKAAMLVKDEHSSAPSTDVLGIRVHSGDLLVSRGGAAASALISRGNDYPGNFSHVALIYIDEKQTPFLIEAHIEKGVAIASLEQYIKDEKLRCMVLRPRSNLPGLVANPLLAHQAARMVYEEVKTTHIPYDFKMNHHDPAAMFCSEVGSYAYKKMGIQLWQGLSTISARGVVNWLSAFGVENFVTQMPADLEYDPQLSIVAEWRNPETLFKDHLDNAVTDVLLEQADKGKTLDYPLWLLPVVRVVKGWCILNNLAGKPAIIPEGMSAVQALRNKSYEAMYNQLRERTTLLVNEFKQTNHYQPPYWQLLALTRTAVK